MSSAWDTILRNNLSYANNEIRQVEINMKIIILMKLLKDRGGINNLLRYPRGLLLDIIINIFHIVNILKNVF